jgi:YggT family protein
VAEVTGGEVIAYFVYFLQIAVLARVLLSWITPAGQSNNVLVNLVYQITEPILAPLRKVIPRVGLFDFTPMIAIVVLGIIAEIFRQAGG